MTLPDDHNIVIDKSLHLTNQPNVDFNYSPFVLVPVSSIWALTLAKHHIYPHFQIIVLR